MCRLKVCVGYKYKHIYTRSFSTHAGAAALFPIFLCIPLALASTHKRRSLRNIEREEEELHSESAKSEHEVEDFFFGLVMETLK